MAGDIPELTPLQPKNLQLLSDKEIEAYAESLSKTQKAKDHGVSKDELINWLNEMKAKGMKLTSSRLDSLLSGEPILSPPKMSLEAMLDYFDRESGGNPFLRASLLTIFTIVFLEITAEMAEIGASEAEIVAESMLLLKEMGLFKAEMKIKIAKVESDLAKAAMWASIATAALSAGSMALGKNFAMAGSQVASGLASAGENWYKGGKILEKGGYEATLEFYNSITSIFERRMQAAGEAQKDYRDLVTKFIDAFNQMAKSIQTGYGINPEKGG